MFRKIMIAAFVAVTLIVSVTPAVMKANDIRRDLTQVIARANDDKAALNDTLSDDAGSAAGETKDLTCHASLRQNVEMDRAESYTAQVTELAMECGKALRGANMFSSNVLGVLGGIVRNAMGAK